MFKKNIQQLSLKNISVILLIFAAVYFLAFTILHVSIHVPKPIPWFLWAPFALWAVFFFYALVVSLKTQKYSNLGNLIFHGAFIIIATGVLLSYFFRFSGSAIIEEGESFFGEESDYAVAPRGSEFERLAPDVSFRLDSVVPEYWGAQFFFTQLDATIKYPVESLDKTAVIDLAGETYIKDARLRVEDFGFYPVVDVLGRSGKYTKGPVRILVFPPTMAEDYFEISGYKFYVKVFSDPLIDDDGTVHNLSMNVNNPAFIVRVVWLNEEIYNGVLRVGELLRTKNLEVKFTGLKYWVKVGIVRDPGEYVVLVGFLVAIAGLMMRVAVYFRRGGEFLPKL